jgi:hypothetical protein
MIYARQAPSLRTVDIDRVSTDGIDFVMKKGSATVDRLSSPLGEPLVSILITHGEYRAGRTVQQYRAEGCVKPIALSEELQVVIPQYTVVSMVGSHRLRMELAGSNDRANLDASLTTSHATQVMQQTRRDYENNAISFEEYRECIQPLQFQPTRFEYMKGDGTHSIMWERWEWNSTTDESTSSVVWEEPHLLVPH